MHSDSVPIDRLKAAGLRVTGPRVAILESLVADDRHPTAEQLHETLRVDHPSISLSTVYKTIESFLRVGLCRRISGDGHRLRIDGTDDDHDHAVCRVCGHVFDVDRELCPRPVPPPRLPHGLELHAVRIEYEVLCAGCAGVLEPLSEESAAR